jgi:hypothetical protein
VVDDVRFALRLLKDGSISGAQASSVERGNGVLDGAVVPPQLEMEKASTR